MDRGAQAIPALASIVVPSNRYLLDTGNEVEIGRGVRHGRVLALEELQHPQVIAKRLAQGHL